MQRTVLLTRQRGKWQNFEKGGVRTRAFDEIEPGLKTFVSQGEEQDKVGNKGRGRTWRRDEGLTR